MSESNYPRKVKLGGMQSFIKVASDFDVIGLKRALISQPTLFGERKDRATYGGSPHGAMTDIWVRYNHPDNLKSGGLGVFNQEHDSVWYPVADRIPEVKPIVFRLMALVEGERLGGVLITKLPPGGRIAPHIDRGWHAGYYEKFYVPVQNGPGGVFGFDDGDLDAREGEVFWFRNDVPHWVNNDSKADRISMIVCIKSDKYKRFRE